MKKKQLDILTSPPGILVVLTLIIFLFAMVFSILTDPIVLKEPTSENTLKISTAEHSF